MANGGNPELIVRGNENVLSGRLDDAFFSYERDVAVGIEDMAARLDSVRFHAKAGYASPTRPSACRPSASGSAAASPPARPRVSRRPTRSRRWCTSSRSSRASWAASTRASPGVPEAVAAAIEEQYLPDASGGPLPATAAGRVLAAADKIDNLTVAFALGERPTGSRDPFGLRRAAIGLCRLAVEGGLEIELPRARRSRRSAT